MSLNMLSISVAMKDGSEWLKNNNMEIYAQALSFLLSLSLPYCMYVKLWTH